MKRIILAGLVGGIIYYAWGMAAWMVVGLHNNTVQSLPDTVPITTALTSRDLQTGVYVSPHSPDPEDWQNPESEFMKAHLAGPVYAIYYQRDGSLPMGTKTLLQGLLIDLLAATLAACLLSSTLRDCRGYAHRVGFVVGLGVFVALVGHGSYWNWMRFPTPYTLAFVADTLIGWTLAGLAIAAIIKPCDNHEAVGKGLGMSVREVAPTADAVRTVPSQSKSESKPPAKPTRNDAITLLATLQREARFIDIVKEPLSDYSDAQVGAATRDVLRDCGTVLDRLFDLHSVVTQAEGSSVDVPTGFDAGRYRVTGNVSGEPPYNGALVHHGWEAKKCSLPQWTGSADAARVVAPAEIEVK